MSAQPVIQYKNARVIDALQDQMGCVYIKGNEIIAVNADLPCDEAIDLHGMALMPAFIDMHTHLRDPGYTYKETLETGMRAALKGGYATLCAMANTNPVCETNDQICDILKRAESLNLAHLFQSAAAGKGLGDEVPTDYAALSRVVRVITNDGKTIFSDDFMRNLLIASKEYGFLISTHCQPEEEIVQRDIRLLREVGGNLHVGHISTKQTVQMICEAKAEGLQLTCEVTPHHLFGAGMEYRVNPSLNTTEDVDALVEAIKDGIVDCFATDHAPHSAEDKQKGAPGISNIEHAAQIYWTVCSERGISPSVWSKCASCTPAKLLGIKAGLIQPGYEADLVVFDLNANETICADDMISKSHNTPFDQKKVKGKVIKTIVGGKLLYDDGSSC